LIYTNTLLLLPVYVPEVNSEVANAALRGAEEFPVGDLAVAEFLVGRFARGPFHKSSPYRFRRSLSGT